MRVFAKLRALDDYQRHHLPELRTAEDHELVREIGLHQVLGAPLALKQVMLLGAGSAATKERRLARLKRLGLVRGQRSGTDKRVIELTLSPACMRAYARFDHMLAAGPEPHSGSGKAAAGARHMCSFCDGEAKGRAVIVRYLAEGLRQDERCVLVAPKAKARAIVGALPQRLRRLASSGGVALSAGEPTVKEMAQFLRGAFSRAHAEGKRIRFASLMSWTVAHDIGCDGTMRIEREVDRLVGRYGGHALCQYDVRGAPASLLLEVVRCHRDMARMPFLLC